MRVAVASRDGVKIAGHIGKCETWIVFEAEPPTCGARSVTVHEVERIKLPKEKVFHHYKDGSPHPLGDCVAVIGASAGESFVTKMAKRGIEAVLTAEPDPATAVANFLKRDNTPAKPRPIGGLICKVRDMFSER